METMVDSQSMEFLQTKRTELAAPGMKMTDQYYTKFNSAVGLAECTFNLGRYTVSLTQNSFGSTSQVTIPNGSLLSKVYLHLELPPLVANQTICRGWGYQSIAAMEFLLGSSNVGLLNYSGATMWTAIVAQCEMNEKASEMFSLGGQEASTVTGSNLFADILLEFPWSNACGGMTGKKPLDLAIINQPLTFTIRFHAANKIYGGIGATPTAFLNATIVAHQGDFTNKEQSLATVMRRDPNLMYTYPWIYHQDLNTAQFIGSTTVPLTVTLNGLLMSDLVGLYFYAVQVANLQNVGGNSPNQFATDDILNIQLLYNGQVMYQAPGLLYRLHNMNNTAGASSFNNSVLTSIPGGGLAPYLSTPVSSYMTFIDFGRLRSTCFNDQMQNTWRIGNNSLSLRFNTSTTNLYQLFVSMQYNAIIELQNQQSKIYFD
jgi:hypothetical protein